MDHPTSRRAFWLLAAAIMLAVLALVWLQTTRPRHPSPRARTAALVRVLVVSSAHGIAQLGPRRGDAVPGDTAWIAAAAYAFYRERSFDPAWSDGLRPHPRAFQLIQALGGARREGLDPDRYGHARLTAEVSGFRLSAHGPQDSPVERLAALDLLLTRAFLRYGSDLHLGRVPRESLDADWEVTPVDLVARLRHAVSRNRVLRNLEELIPPGPAYRGMREELDHYRSLAQAGGWPRISSGVVLRRGSEGQRVRALRRRLALAGDLAEADSSGPFDRRLAAAVAAFQNRHGLPASGVVDAVTLTALNVPASRRVRQIELNLERLRWMHEPGGRFIVVNIPDYRLSVVSGDTLVMSMPVVVGKRTHPTPVMSDLVSYLELNPTWTVPRRILAQEVLPALASDTSYLTTNRMRVLRTNREVPELVDAATVDWTALTADTFSFIVRQEAGPENPLGRIKFMCPNEYDVYLHDTPARGHFGRALRTLSHGCVRVPQAAELAEHLLRDTRWAGRDSLDAILASGTSRLLGLRTKIAVHLLYWTAWVDRDGAIQFRDDVYGLDQRLEAALADGLGSEFRLNPEALWNPLVESPNRPAGATPIAAR